MEGEIRPLGVNIAVEKDTVGEVREAGILIPASLLRTPRYSPTVFGTVRGVGAKVGSVKVGDRVALKAHAGDDWLVGKTTYTILREKDLVGLAT